MESTLLNVHHLKREVQDNFPSNYFQTPYSHQSLLGLCHLQGRILTNAGASDFKSLVRMLSVLTATSFQTSGGKSPLHLWLLPSAAGLDATFYDESFDSLPDDWKSPRSFSTPLLNSWNFYHSHAAIFLYKMQECQHCIHNVKALLLLFSSCGHILCYLNLPLDEIPAAMSELENFGFDK